MQILLLANRRFERDGLLRDLQGLSSFISTFPERRERSCEIETLRFRLASCRHHTYVRLLLVPPWPPGARGLHFLFLDVGHQGFGGQRQGGDRRSVQAGAGRAVAPDREGTVVVDRVRESKDRRTEPRRDCRQ